jgi:hypothetical protein
MADAIFFLKSSVPKGLPANVKGIQLDPVALGFECDGTDKHCSTAYSQMWSHYGSTDALRSKYGIDGKIAFVSFSAGHGFMAPLLNSDKDRADVTSVLLLDSTFGYGPPGYVKAAHDAVAGKLQLVSVTSDKGTTNAGNDGDYAWRQLVLKPSGISMGSEPARSPMPAPALGVQRAGDLWYYRYKDAEIHHWDMYKLLSPTLDAHVLPYLRGERGSKTGGWMYWALGLVTVAAFAFLWKRDGGEKALY